MTRFVLDSSTVLAVLKRERGAERVREVMQGAAISAVSYCEIATKLRLKGLPETSAAFVLLGVARNVIPFDLAQAELAGKMVEATREHGLSLGDRACLALARSLGAVAITTDQAWERVDVGVPVELIR